VRAVIIYILVLIIIIISVYVSMFEVMSVSETDIPGTSVLWTRSGTRVKSKTAAEFGTKTKTGNCT